MIFLLFFKRVPEKISNKLLFFSIAIRYIPHTLVQKPNKLILFPLQLTCIRKK